MLAGVPSSTPSAASRSAAPADSAGRRHSSTSSTRAAPSFTASSTACRAGEGVWWTTSRRGTRAFSPPWQAPGMHLVLEYSLADDYLERRAALREERLALARAAHGRGELLLAGALPDPFDRALLVWTAPREVVERFVADDPYVTEGLVTGWSIRTWNVVVG